MSLLAESNSLKKVNMRNKVPKVVMIKRIIYVILLVIIVGVAIQLIYNFVSGEMIKTKGMYATIDSKKIYFNTEGSGDYTIIFDGPIGDNMYEWNKTIEGLERQGVKTFVYNRNGYGFSSSSPIMTPKEQAEQLNQLLKKAAIGGKYILVGEGYGSLVLTNYAKLYPQNIKGVVLINPIDEKNKEEYDSIKNKFSLVGKKIQELGANCSLTWLLDKVGLATSYPDFEKGLTNEKELDQYNWLKNQAPYRKAIYNESKNLYNMNSDSQQAGMFSNIPYYLISNTKDNPLKDLGSKDNTIEFYKDYTGTSFASENPKDVSSAIIKVVDQAVRIKAREQEASKK